MVNWKLHEVHGDRLWGQFVVWRGQTIAEFHACNLWKPSWLAYFGAIVLQENTRKRKFTYSYSMCRTHEQLTPQRMTGRANEALGTRRTLTLLYLEFYACEEIGKFRLLSSKLVPFHKSEKVKFYILTFPQK